MNIINLSNFPDPNINEWEIFGSYFIYLNKDRQAIAKPLKIYQFDSQGKTSYQVIWSSVDTFTANSISELKTMLKSQNPVGNFPLWIAPALVMGLIYLFMNYGKK